MNKNQFRMIPKNSCKHNEIFHRRFCPVKPKFLTVWRMEGGLVSGLCSCFTVAGSCPCTPLSTEVISALSPRIVRAAYLSTQVISRGRVARDGRPLTVCARILGRGHSRVGLTRNPRPKGAVFWISTF